MNPDEPTVLLTGFEPFDSRTLNPSWEAVRLLADRPDGAKGGSRYEPTYDLRVAELPCEFQRCGDRLAELVEANSPDLVICVGEAAGRSELSVERIAINVSDARIPDNSGCQPIDEPIVPGAPAAYFSTLPIKTAVSAARAAGVPAAVSQTAGTYVCNDVFYRLMHMIAVRYPHVRGGFVHVPSLPVCSTAGSGSGDKGCADGMRVETAATGLARIVDACLATHCDIAAVGGAEH